MRSCTPRDLLGVCPRCFLKLEHCLCMSLPRVPNKLEVVIIRHVTEEWLTSNTARLASLMLEKLRIVPYAGGKTFSDPCLADPNACLLVLDARSTLPPVTPSRLVLLDGTFRQARRMFKKIPGLHNLQQYSLGEDCHRIPGLRRPPRGDGLSTIEAIAAALAQFESPALAEPILSGYTEFVRRVDLVRGRIRPAQTSEEPAARA